MGRRLEDLHIQGIPRIEIALEENVLVKRRQPIRTRGPLDVDLKQEAPRVVALEPILFEAQWAGEQSGH
jgi:hypothetical protein